MSKPSSTTPTSSLGLIITFATTEEVNSSRLHRTNLRVVRETRLYNRTTYLEMHEALRRTSVGILTLFNRFSTRG
jgi:hypothetical protein